MFALKLFLSFSMNQFSTSEFLHTCLLNVRPLYKEGLGLHTHTVLPFEFMFTKSKEKGKMRLGCKKIIST